MKHRIKQEKGISMVALVITVIILVILTNVLIYNASDNVYIKSLTDLYNDISMLREKISSYYNEYGKIPAKIEYKITDELSSVLSTKNDTGKFYVIDLEAMQGITLNYGRDYEDVKNDKDNANNYTDLYIINENSHNIFYVQGITIKENNTIKTYYTDYIEPDETTIDLRYVDKILIPDGCYYIGKTSDDSIVISTTPGEKIDANSENQYTWTKQIAKLEKKPDSVNLVGNQIEYQFIKSVNTYKGYFKNYEGKVQYIVIDEEKWSEAYTKEIDYEDINGDKVTIPEGFRVSMAPTMNTIENGFVVKDSNDNEWVWIEVPKSVFTTAVNNTDYDNIKSDLKRYAKDYRKGSSTQNFDWDDEWYDGCGIADSETYTEMYNKMLSSVYTNKGFWIARYEAGIEGTNTNTTSSEIAPVRYSYSAITSESPKAVSQANRIPYNFLYCSEAQKLATNMGKGTNKTSSLLFGIQWDLVCKYLEVNEFYNTKSDLTSSGISWGNYKNSSLSLKPNSRYCTSASSSSGNWLLYKVTSDFVKLTDNLYKTNIDENYDGILTTGASEDTNKMNIYDFAGNVWEWTLEHAISGTDGPCARRGGSFEHNGSKYPATCRSDSTIVDSHKTFGFRSTLY